MSGRTLEKAKAVVEAAESDPERCTKLAHDMDWTGRVVGVFRRMKVFVPEEQIAQPPPLPEGLLVPPIPATPSYSHSARVAFTPKGLRGRVMDAVPEPKPYIRP